MLKRFLGCFVAVISATAPSLADDVLDICPSIGGLARNIMTKRQGGVDMSAVMQAIESKEVVPEIKDVARSFVIAAYDEPLFSTEEVKAQIIAEFSNQMQVKCYQRVQSRQIEGAANGNQMMDSD